MKKILTVLGARPQIIKSAAITRVINSTFSGFLEEVVLNTGQHYDANMSDDFFKELFIPIPKYSYTIDFNKANTIGQMIAGIDSAISIDNPDIILVYGDTNSTLAGTISACKNNIPLIHVEAGLRSFNIEMPEEGNRILTDHSSQLLFSPTEEALNNLENERIPSENVFHCGDIMFDNSLFYKNKAKKHSTILKRLNLKTAEFILFTCHRQSNTDFFENLRGIIDGVKQVSKLSGKKIIFPIHPRTSKRILEYFGEKYFNDLSNYFNIVEPLSFLDTIQLEVNCAFIITDSGGVLKEGYFFNKKTLILRNQTEWIEIVKNDAALLVGSRKEQIVEGYQKLEKMSPRFEPVFGDGNASSFICKTIIDSLK
jgi:UDP-GlcNAc3NAcA epimerase